MFLKNACYVCKKIFKQLLILNQENLLNKKSELISKCRHESIHLL